MKTLKRAIAAAIAILALPASAMAVASIISFASSAAIVASTGLSAATTQTSEVQFGSWDIGSTCRGPVVVWFYNSASPTFGTTAVIWSVYIPSPSNAPNPLSYAGDSHGSMIVAITGLTALSYIAQSLNSESCTVYVATT